MVELDQVKYKITQFNSITETLKKYSLKIEKKMKTSNNKNVIINSKTLINTKRMFHLNETAFYVNQHIVVFYFHQ
jgi:hypothetical protein